MELTLDTGFGGGILIPFTLFQSIGLLNALSLDSYYAVMPDFRRTVLYTAKAKVTVGTTSILAEVHSSPIIERRLLGRSFLRSFVTVLHGRKQEMKISDTL
jgi:predicted aspartyl protease